MFEPFDEEVISRELAGLPARDAAKLTALMIHYQTCGTGNPAPVQIDDYGDGILRLRHIKPAYQGRMLFFCVDQSSSKARLIILAIYKKEGDAVPARVLRTARTRRQDWQAKQK